MSVPSALAAIADFINLLGFAPNIAVVVSDASAMSFITRLNGTPAFSESPAPIFIMFIAASCVAPPNPWNVANTAAESSTATFKLAFIRATFVMASFVTNDVCPNTSVSALAAEYACSIPTPNSCSSMLTDSAFLRNSTI